VGKGLGVEVGVGVRVGKGVGVGVAVLVARGGNVGEMVGSTVIVQVGTSRGLPTVAVGIGATGMACIVRIEWMTIPARPAITLTSKIAKTIRTVFCRRLSPFIESFPRTVRALYVIHL